ncbi:peptidase propeptide and ypeb domain protein [Bacillus freudenreichii]|nr:peptidase propeptide and ypeb domain protein [Bacillus freudenreichii]
MMKRKFLIGIITGLIILGGAVGAGAAPKTDAKGVTSSDISLEAAKEIALQEFGGKVESIELEKDNGHLVYEIELLLEKTGDEIDLDIDAKSGKVMNVEREKDDTDQASKQEKAVKAVKIPMIEAIANVEKDNTGVVMKAELDIEDGYYKIEILKGQTEIEYKVDVNNGNIIEKEIDND